MKQIPLLPQGSRGHHGQQKELPGRLDAQQVAWAGGTQRAKGTGQTHLLFIDGASELGRVNLDTPRSPKAPLGSLGLCVKTLSQAPSRLFQETSKRLSNQIPFIIQFFILRENGDCLQKAMLKILQEKDRYCWLLQEHRETAAKRKVLKERLSRLAQAQRTLWQFSKGGVY